jgi:hypothetical protein
LVVDGAKCSRILTHQPVNQNCTSNLNPRRLFGVGEAAKALGVSMTTLRRWEAQGRLIAEHTVGVFLGAPPDWVGLIERYELTEDGSRCVPDRVSAARRREPPKV